MPDATLSPFFTRCLTATETGVGGGGGGGGVEGVGGHE